MDGRTYGLTEKVYHRVASLLKKEKVNREIKMFVN